MSYADTSVAIYLKATIINRPRVKINFSDIAKFLISECHFVDMGGTFQIIIIPIL